MTRLHGIFHKDKTPLHSAFMQLKLTRANRERCLPRKASRVCVRACVRACVCHAALLLTSATMKVDGFSV
jgi:hypothetical protein